MDLEIIFYRMKMKWYSFINFFRYNLYGRIKYGFNMMDTWNLDYTMSKFIYPRLKYFRDNCSHGYPAILDSVGFIAENDLGQYVVSNDNGDNFDTWLNILDNMLIGFKSMASDDLYSLESHEQNCESLRLFSLFYTGLWT
jgi:hypothetical protein